jgi:hypothetical protein
MANRRQLPPLQSATEVETQETITSGSVLQLEDETNTSLSHRPPALTQPTNILSEGLVRQEDIATPTPLMGDADDMAAPQQSRQGVDARPSRSLAIQSLRSGTHRRETSVPESIPRRNTLTPQPRNLMAMAAAEPDPVAVPPVFDPQHVDHLASSVALQVAQQIHSVETALDGVNAQVTSLPDAVQDLLQQVQDNTLAHLAANNPQTAMAGVEEALASLQAQQASQIQQLQGVLKHQAMMTRLMGIAVMVAVILGVINLVHVQDLPRQIQQVHGQQDDTNRRLDQLRQTTRFIESHVQTLTSKVQRALTPPAPVVPGDGPMPVETGTPSL